MKKYLACISLLHLLVSQHAIAETWECQVVHDYPAFVEDDISESKKHTFVRASSSKYIHTFEVDYVEDGGRLISKKETQDLRVIRDGFPVIFAVNVDLNTSTSVSLNQVAPKGPYVQVTRHGIGYPIEGAGTCAVTCNDEDKTRIKGADKVCSLDDRKLKAPWLR